MIKLACTSGSASLEGGLVSLVRLLVALSPSRLAQLARVWGVSVPPTDGLAARLYHEMTEDWSVARVLDRLDEAQRVVLYRLADERRGWATGADLLRGLPFTPERLEELLVGLRDRGLVAISSLDGPSLQGTTSAGDLRARPRVGPQADWSTRWTCCVPSDLAQVIRRVRAQAADEERGQESLRRMLGALDLPALQRLALRWNVPRTERSFKRELIRSLEGRFYQQELVARVLGGVDPAARRVFDAIQSAGGRVPLAVAQEQLALSDEALRAAFRSLHELFLVHESWANGVRILFVPAEVSQGHRPDAPEGVPELAQVGPPPVVAPADADLLADLSRLLALAKSHPIRRQHHAAPGGQQGASSPAEPGVPAGEPGGAGALSPRAHYLVHACLTLRLLQPGECGLAPVPGVEAWEQLDAEARIEALFRALLAEERWREPGLADVPRSAPPARLRRWVLEALDSAQVGRWYALGSVSRRARAKAWLGGQPGASAEPNSLPDSRRVLAMLASALHWLGVVALGYNADGRPVAVQLTGRGRRLVNGVLGGGREPVGSEAGPSAQP